MNESAATTLAEIQAATESADTAEQLRAALGDAFAAATAHKVRATAIAAQWSTLARTAVASAHRLVSADTDVGGGVTWHVSGSVGRGEALPGADLETLLVHEDALDNSAAMAHAGAVHDLLDACGFRRDDKGAVGNRARFCRTRAGWETGIAAWAAHPAQDRGVVMVGLIADSLPLSGNYTLRGHLGTAVRAHSQALPSMLQDATSPRAAVPSRLRTLATRDDTVDVKTAVLEPVVKIARWAGLHAGSNALGTVDRLTEATFLDGGDRTALQESYLTATRLRWMLRAPTLATGNHAPDDTVALSALTPQDRAALRGAGRTVAGVMRKLTYLASTSAFSQW